MRIKEMMSRDPVGCAPGDTLQRAAQLMWENDVGSLPVCSETGQLVGMITDRDICMSGYLQGRSLHEMHVSDAMASQVVTCSPEDSVDQVEGRMTRARIRRMPVTAADGTLVGVITLADLALEAQREQTLQKRDVTCSDVGLTLAAICEPSKGMSRAVNAAR